MAAHSTVLAWRIPKDRGAWQATVHGVTKSWTRLSDLAQPEQAAVQVWQGWIHKKHFSLIIWCLIIGISSLECSPCVKPPSRSIFLK